MIDTVKIYTKISECLYNEIDKLSDTVAKFNVGQDIIYYKLSSGSVKGSYESSLHFRPSQAKYGDGYWLELERKLS